MGSKPFCIWFDKIDGLIKVCDGIRYLILFASEKYNATYGRVNYLIIGKNGVTYSINQNIARIRADLYKLLIRVKITTSIICFLEKGLYEDKSNTQYF